jgi:hypothetical protein
VSSLIKRQFIAQYFWQMYEVVCQSNHYLEPWDKLADNRSTLSTVHFPVHKRVFSCSFSSPRWWLVYAPIVTRTSIVLFPANDERFHTFCVCEIDDIMIGGERRWRLWEKWNILDVFPFFLWDIYICEGWAGEWFIRVIQTVYVLWKFVIFFVYLLRKSRQYPKKL